MIICQAKLDEYLKKIHAHVCPLCGESNWTVSDTIFYAQELTRSKEKGNLVIGEPSRYIPFIAISCNNCGNTHIINTLVADLYNFREERQQDDQKPKEDQ